MRFLSGCRGVREGEKKEGRGEERRRGRGKDRGRERRGGGEGWGEGEKRGEAERVREEGKGFLGSPFPAVVLFFLFSSFSFLLARLFFGERGISCVSIG